MAQQRLGLSFADIAQQGDCFSRHNGEVVFTPGAIPGEEAIVEVRRWKRRYLWGEVVELVKASPHRRQPRCRHFGQCSGCQWQHIDYPFQLELKRRMVERQLSLRGALSQPAVLPTLPAIEPWHYRNHARFSVDPQGQLGFIQRQTRQLIPIDLCHLMHPQINRLLGELQGRCAGAHQVAVRYGVRTGDLLLQPRLELKQPSIASGQPFYEEELLGRRFRISAPSFFQVNTLGAERLVEVVRDRLNPHGGELVIDVYAGVGTFATLLAPLVGRVIAIEEASSAVKDAAINMAGLENVEFLEGKAEGILPWLSPEADALILDPPRIGCHPKALAALLKLVPKKIIYVSCEPSTLARDVRTLCDGGYRLLEVQPVDMFPQTYHVECVATLVNEQGFLPELVLASASPRRRELLFALGLDFDVIVPPEGETTPAQEAPEAVAEKLAMAKAMEVSKGMPSKTVVAADTVVVHRGMVLGKPRDAAEAERMLRQLRGDEHLVISGVAVIDAGGHPMSGHASTRVFMRHYSDEEIAAYIASGDALDKAGAYGIQSPVFAPSSHIEGCYQNVVGLPLCLLARMLEGAGIKLRPRPLWALPPKCHDCPERGTLSGN